MTWLNSAKSEEAHRSQLGNRERLIVNQPRDEKDGLGAHKLKERPLQQDGNRDEVEKVQLGSEAWKEVRNPLLSKIPVEKPKKDTSVGREGITGWSNSRTWRSGSTEED